MKEVFDHRDWILVYFQCLVNCSLKVSIDPYTFFNTSTIGVARLAGTIGIAHLAN